ncbi:MAG: insulinase family protein [Myxococcales bacterium]|nr:insulinase family protein [Myxococcales bacterium]
MTSLLLPSHVSARLDATAPAVTAEEPAAGEDDDDASTSEAGAALTDPRVPGHALDAVLPCGLRVLVARDASLPVAAVILALEVGSEDDPPELQGLHHALAYQLLLGSRELRPGELLATVNDAGGITRLATGAAQIRFESLLPVARLDQLLWAESHRMQTVTVTDSTWRRALSWAGDDTRVATTAPREAIAAAHGDVKGLEHDGRRVSPALRKLTPQQVRARLKQSFRYDGATLIVVAPSEPEETLKRVKKAFRELPAQARRVPSRSRATTDAPAPAPTPSVDPSEASEVAAPRPRVVAVGRRTTPAFVWPIAGTPRDELAATVLCKVLNSQRRAGDEPRRAKIRCHHELDVRRAALVVWSTGVEDPYALVRARVERIAAGRERGAIDRIRGELRANLRHELRTPIELARRLAFAPIDGGDGGRRLLEEYTGLSLLGDPESIEASATSLFDPTRGVEVTREQKPSAPERGASEEAASEEASEADAGADQAAPAAVEGTAGGRP